MDPILSEVYSTVLPAAPYVLAARAGANGAAAREVMSDYAGKKRSL